MIGELAALVKPTPFSRFVALLSNQGLKRRKLIL